VGLYNLQKIDGQLFLLCFFLLTAALAKRGAFAAKTANARLTRTLGRLVQRHAALAFFFGHNYSLSP